MSAVPRVAASAYFVPPPSGHPAMAAAGVLGLAFGAAQWLNGAVWGGALAAVGLLGLWVVLYAWFTRAIRESESGRYGPGVDRSFRWSMSWFIFSEVMFFAAFFSALWWTRNYALPELASVENALLWPGFNATWPSPVSGPGTTPGGLTEPFQAAGPLWLPTFNTALLLASGVTLTWAHHAMRAGKRGHAIVWLWLTIALGTTFLVEQAYEYAHAYMVLNLKLSSGIYGSTFYLLTGFHGFHVMLGLTMLVAVTLRLQRGHFSAGRHFGFEGAAWYWHFVDVVWLALYVLVYWL